MNWHTDPPNGWTALYRMFVIVALCFLTWAHVYAGNIPNPLNVLNEVVPVPRR